MRYGNNVSKMLWIDITIGVTLVAILIFASLIAVKVYGAEKDLDDLVRSARLLCGDGKSQAIIQREHQPRTDSKRSTNIEDKR
jgi:hypothetical protein